MHIATWVLNLEVLFGEACNAVVLLHAFAEGCKLLKRIVQPTLELTCSSEVTNLFQGQDNSCHFILPIAYGICMGWVCPYTVRGPCTW